MASRSNGPPAPLRPDLVVSGGALKTVSALGIAECFREHGLGFGRFLGCSGGAVMAALLAAALLPRDALRAVLERGSAVLFGPRVPTWAGFLSRLRTGWGAGLLDPAGVGTALVAQIGTDDFDALPGILAVNAVHLRTGVEVFFSGKCFGAAGRRDTRVCRRQGIGAAVAASVALPLMFRPARLESCRDCRERTCGISSDPREDGGLRFVDGGLLNHLPVAPAGSVDGLPVVAVSARIEGSARRLPVDGWTALDTLHRAADIVLGGQVEAALAQCMREGTRVVSLMPPVWESPLFETSAQALEWSFQAGQRTGEVFFRSLRINGRTTWGDVAGRLPRQLTTIAPEAF